MQINVPVNFNLADQEEELDLAFLDSKGKRSTKIKEWLRAWRNGDVPDVNQWIIMNRLKGIFVQDVPISNNDDVAPVQLHEMSEEEALESVF